MGVIETLRHDVNVVVDTRNKYEVDLGTFKDAVALDIDTFRDFPAALKQAAAENVVPKDKKILMFCTGGIRCEKAAFSFVNEGYSAENLYQLDGGILSFFNEVEEKQIDDVYEGGCYVFDDRICVDKQLKVMDVRVCFKCRGNPKRGREEEGEEKKVDSEVAQPAKTDAAARVQPSGLRLIAPRALGYPSKRAAARSTSDRESVPRARRSQRANGSLRADGCGDSRTRE